MRILVVSDTHGRIGNLEYILPKVGKIDYLFHLGDIGNDADYLEGILRCPCAIVAGNNDIFSNLPKERVFPFMGQRFFLTHGDRYYVHRGTEYLLQAAKAREASIVLFGHTHVPFAEWKEGILFLNPGSLSLPRQSDHFPTYAMLELQENQEPTYEIFRVEK